jgi:hypothetical protein
MIRFSTIEKLIVMTEFKYLMAEVDSKQTTQQ